MRDINQSIATANYRKRVERLLREVKITKADNSAFTNRDEDVIFQSADNGGRLFLAANYEIVNKKKVIFAYDLAEHGFGAQNTTVGSKARFASAGYIIVPPTLAFSSQEWQKQVYRDLDVELPQVHSLRKAVLESDKPKAPPLLSQQPTGSNQWHPNSFQSANYQRNMNAASREWGTQSQQAPEFQTPLHPRGGGRGEGKGGSWTHTWSGKGKGGYGSSHSDGGYGYGQSWQGSSVGAGSQQSWQGSQHSSNDNFSNEAYGQSRGRSRDRGSNRGDKRNSDQRSRSRDGGKPLIPPSGGHTALGAIIAKMTLTSMCV